MFCRAPTKKMWKSLKAASSQRTKSERGIFTQKTMATGWSREISYRSAKTRCKILSSARGCSLLAVCVNLSCLFKNKLGLIFFRGFWNFIFAKVCETTGKLKPWFCFCGDYHWCPYTTAIDKLLLKKFLKSHSTSALPSYRLIVVSLGPLLARFSTCSFLKLWYSIRLTVIFATTYDYCQSLFLYECHRHQTDTCRTICVAMTLENSLFMA